MNTRLEDGVPARLFAVESTGPLVSVLLVMLVIAWLVAGVIGLLAALETTSGPDGQDPPPCLCQS